MNHPLSNLRPAPALGFSSAVGLALTVVLTGALACNSPSVISSDRAPGAGGGSGAPSGGPGGSGTSGGTAGSSGIALPDAATGQVDVAPAPPMACAEEAYKAEAVPLDLLLLLDSSGSMDGRVGGATKWQLAQTALASFVRDQRSAGLGMGLQYFPNPKRCQGFLDCIATASQCQANDRCIDAAGVSGQLCGGLFGGNCMSGSTCAPTGICSNSFTGCTNIGQP
ncbi:MAG TPA: hypothetical protein VGG33_26475, partial [Polyangia bacterium]